MTITVGTAPEVGTSVRLYISTVDPGGNPSDADTLEILVKDPAGETTTYVYGASPEEIVHPSEGQYYLDVEATAKHEWFFRGEAEGLGWLDVEEGSFVVRTSQVI